MNEALLSSVPDVAADETATLLRGRKFVWLLSPPWDNVWTRQNHFSLRLAKHGAEVFYVENPTSWSTRLRRRQARSGQTSVREVQPGLFVSAPPLTLPGMKQSETIARLNGWLVARHTRQWLQRQHWTRYSCWCRVPHSVFALNHLSPDVTVYDITDDYPLYERTARCRKRVTQRQSLLLHRADLVLVTAQELQAQPDLQPYSPHLIPNGVEYDLFAQASQPGPIDELVQRMKKPVIGYVGLTSHWMDFQLLTQLGQRWPGQILMLGPIAAEVEARAKAIPGLVWGGFVPQPKLPPYLRGIDVCIMPHLVNELRKRANPLKIWEYLATGKPFVSVDLPALAPVRHLVDVARDRDHFVQLVEQRLNDPVPARGLAAQAYAKTQSWDALFEQMMQQLAPRLVAA